MIEQATPPSPPRLAETHTHSFLAPSIHQSALLHPSIRALCGPTGSQSASPSTCRDPQTGHLGREGGHTEGAGSTRPLDHYHCPLRRHNLSHASYADPPIGDLCYNNPRTHRRPAPTSGTSIRSEPTQTGRRPTHAPVWVLRDARVGAWSTGQRCRLRDQSLL